MISEIYDKNYLKEFCSWLLDVGYVYEIVEVTEKGFKIHYQKAK